MLTTDRARPARRCDGHRPLVAAHRRAERRGGHGVVAAGHGDRRARLVTARGRCAAARGHRRRGDPQCAARPARQSGRRGRRCPPTPSRCCAASRPNTTNCATRSRCCVTPPTGWPPAPTRGTGIVDPRARLPHRPDPAARTRRGNPALSGVGPPAGQRRSHRHHEPHPRRDPAACRSDRHPPRTRPGGRRDAARPGRRPAGMPVRPATRCCGCTSCRKKRTTSPSPRTNRPSRNTPTSKTTRHRDNRLTHRQRSRRRGLGADSHTSCRPKSVHRR